jgi:hypothetical protein
VNRRLDGLYDNLRDQIGNPQFSAGSKDGVFMTGEKQPPNTQATSGPSTGSRKTDDGLLKLMCRYNNPITREPLDLAYMGEPPAEVSAEEEANRPPIVKLRVSDGEFGRPCRSGSERSHPVDARFPAVSLTPAISAQRLARVKI